MIPKEKDDITFHLGKSDRLKCIKTLMHLIMQRQKFVMYKMNKYGYHYWTTMILKGYNISN